MTLREHYAGLFMQAIISRDEYPHEYTAIQALRCADLLLDALDEAEGVVLDGPDPNRLNKAEMDLVR